MIIRRALIGGMLALLVVFAGSAAASATETRQFRGDGSSAFGFALEYARRDAERKANDAGFFDCEEIFQFGSPFDVTVIWECTR